MKILLKNKPALISLIFLSILILIVAGSYLGINISGFSFDTQNQDLILNSPTFEHPLGTDQLGRDLLARLIYGARLSLLVGIVTAIIAFFIGVLLGSLAATFEGKTDLMITRMIDIIYSIPDLLVLSIIGLIFNRSTPGILIAIGLISWMDVARLTRAEIIKLKEKEFILSAKAIGLTDLGIFLKYIIPNILTIVMVAITFTMPRAIIAESTLSFLGLGLSPPQCSWGTLASDGWQFINTHINLILYPSLLIMFTVLSLNILGDFLADLNQKKQAYI